MKKPDFLLILRFVFVRSASSVVIRSVLDIEKVCILIISQQILMARYSSRESEMKNPS